MHYLPFLSQGWEEGQFLWDIQMVVMDVYSRVFVWACCTSESVYVWHFFTFMSRRNDLVSIDKRSDLVIRKINSWANKQTAAYLDINSVFLDFNVLILS